jgi:hypothetical protein
MALNSSRLLPYLLKLCGKISDFLVTRITGRRKLDAQLRHYQREIISTESSVRLCRILVEIKAFLVLHDCLMARPNVKEFYDEWLTHPLLDGQGEHPDLCTHDGITHIKRLRADADLLYP